jgi:hypothetical protein
MQAIKYAAMASRFTVDILAEVFAEFQLKHSQKLLTNEEASERIQAHTEFALTDETLRAPRIVLIAGDFPHGYR